MAIKNTFRDVAIANSKKQPQLVDDLFEEAPILAGMPMQAASHGMWNVYEETLSATGASIVDSDEPLPTVASDNKLEQIDLSILGGKIQVGQDKAMQLGGPQNYFASKLPSIIRQTGMDSEQSVIYNNIRKYAEDNSKLIDALGVGSTNYSIICVKWVPGETTGLFNAEGFGDGFVMQTIPINGGNIYENSSGVLIYGMALKTNVGIQLANKRYVTSIVNIDIANSKLPTAAQMDDVISKTRGAPGNTVLYMHEDVKTALYTYKGTALQMSVTDSDLNRVYTTWNGIPIVTSYNFLKGTETKVTV
jgi:hypothetical protein